MDGAVYASATMWGEKLRKEVLYMGTYTIYIYTHTQCTCVGFFFMFYHVRAKRCCNIQRVQYWDLQLLLMRSFCQQRLDRVQKQRVVCCALDQLWSHSSSLKPTCATSDNVQTGSKMAQRVLQALRDILLEGT